MSSFYMPVRVFEEKDAVAHHAKDIKALGNKALLVTGRHSAKSCGAYDDVVEALTGEGMRYALFDEIEENPSTETIMKARDLGVAEQVDVVIGIGGGSPMDAAKAIALMIYHKEADISYLYQADADSHALPIVAIPTTCGTGSEVTAVSVLTDHSKGVKKSIPHKIFADLALLDGTYVGRAPKQVIANTAIDAYAHLCESYLNTKASAYSKMCVDAGLRTWAKSKDILEGKRDAKEADYNNMLRASMFAGMAIAHTATSLPHGFSYTLTYELGMPHGVAVGFFLGGYLAHADAEDRAYLLETAGFSDVEDYRRLYQAICRPGEVAEELLERALGSILENPAKRGAVPYACNEEDLRDMTYDLINHMV